MAIKPLKLSQLQGEKKHQKKIITAHTMECSASLEMTGGTVYLHI